VDVEILKRALRELVEREPAFFRDLFLDALMSDGRAADALLELFAKHPEARLKLAQVVAGSIAVPLNVATKDDIKAAVEELKKCAEEEFVTKEDLKQFATKQDLERFVTKEYFDAVIKRLEDKMATKEQFEAIAVSVEDSGREMVEYLLEQRGYKCTAERLRLDADYELDIYCNAGAVTAVGEAKVRAGGRDVEKALERAQELLRRWPDKISGRIVPVLYNAVAAKLAAKNVTTAATICQLSSYLLPILQAHGINAYCLLNPAINVPQTDPLHNMTQALEEAIARRDLTPLGPYIDMLILETPHKGNIYNPLQVKLYENLTQILQIQPKTAST